MQMVRFGEYHANFVVFGFCGTICFVSHSLKKILANNNYANAVGLSTHVQVKFPDCPETNFGHIFHHRLPNATPALKSPHASAFNLALLNPAKSMPAVFFLDRCDLLRLLATSYLDRFHLELTL
jgi:predicted metal-binding protein